MVYNGVLIETIGISVMVLLGFYSFFSRGLAQMSSSVERIITRKNDLVMIKFKPYISS